MLYSCMVSQVSIYQKTLQIYIDKLQDNQILLTATDTLVSYISTLTATAMESISQNRQNPTDIIAMMCKDIEQARHYAVLTAFAETLLTEFSPHVTLIAPSQSNEQYEKISIRLTKLTILFDIISLLMQPIYALEINMLKLTSEQLQQIVETSMIDNSYTPLTIDTYSNLYSCIIDITQNPITITHHYSINLEALSQICNEYKISYIIIPSSLL